MVPKKNKIKRQDKFRFFSTFKNGDLRTRFSYLIMGFGNITRGQFTKGLIFLAIQISYIFYMFNFGWKYLRDITTLGTSLREKVFDEAKQIYIYTTGDNSLLILLFSIVAIAVSLVFILIYVKNIESSYKAQKLQEQGKRLPRIQDDLKELLDSKFHITLLAFPTFTAAAFTVLPIIFMICMAFTNFDSKHQPPGNLFTWVGLENFKNMLWNNPRQASTMWSIAGWTMIWAIFSTLTCYIFGMLLALLINRKGVRLKKMWRTIFVVTIAVPAFVSLMLVSQLLNDNGALNQLLMEWGWIKEPIKFLSDPIIAKFTVVIVNMWIGIPFTMLSTTGILMNIPAELYESAKIDGASPFKTFMKITLPYMLFVTAPYLITQFIGNINNFNVIYLLTRGDPKSLDYFQAGKTDLLVTWLYKLTVNEQDYNIASTIGIFVFIITAVISLVLFNLSASSRKEEQFQ